MAKKEMDLRFAKFGTVSFTGVSQVNDFIDHLEQGKVMGTRCKVSGKRYFPPRAHCCASLSGDMEWFEVTGSGTLVSFSTLKYAPTGFKEDLPYTIALLDYGDYRVFGRIDATIPLEALEVGMPLKTVAAKTANGQLTYVFKTSS